MDTKKATHATTQKKPQSTAQLAKMRLARAVRDGHTEQAEEARRDLAAANLETYIRRVVDEAPPLTEEQLDKLRLLLRPATARASSEPAA